jgi:hypothetical protein
MGVTLGPVVTMMKERGPEKSCPIGLIEQWIRSLVVSGHPGSQHRGLNVSMKYLVKVPSG